MLRPTRLKEKTELKKFNFKIINILISENKTYFNKDKRHRLYNLILGGKQHKKLELVNKS